MADERPLSPSRQSLVGLVKGHPVVALAAYTIFVIGTVFAGVKSVGVKNIDYFGAEAEMEAQKREVFEQREKTVKAELETVMAKRDCQAVEISALQARNELASLRENLAKCQSSARPVQAAPAAPRAGGIIEPDQWLHEAMPAAGGGAVAERLSELGREPENLSVFYDRRDNVFHIWYSGKDRRVKYEYRVALPSDLGDRPQVNFFKQDSTVVPAGIGGGSPVPIYFRVTK